MTKHTLTCFCRIYWLGDYGDIWEAEFPLLETTPLLLHCMLVKKLYEARGFTLWKVSSCSLTL